MSICLRRREFIAGLGGAAAWPVAARAQQPRAMPVVGYLTSRTADSDASMLIALRRGLGDLGYTEGRNVAIDYRFADGRYDRLSAQLADLTQRKVGVIVLAGFSVGLREQVRASPIPIVYNGDPVLAGIANSLNRPGGNVTGMTSLGNELVGKQLGLLHELLPQASHFGVLSDPKMPIHEEIVKGAQAAASVIGGTIEVLTAATTGEIDAVFTRIANEKRVQGLLVASQPLFFPARVQLAILAARFAVPAMYPVREYVEAGGLLSYGPNIADRDREVGRYVGRILKGEKPADLPVQQQSKFEFVINLQTAKAMGLTIPNLLQSLADKVIESR